MPDFAHTPVLASEVAHYLAPRPGGIYVDGTLGGAGHARQTLEISAPDGRLIGIDRDPAALAAARATLEQAGLAARVTFVHATFGDLAEVLADLGIATVNGILLDLGLSSHQVDTAERGFSFGRGGPIDMRMDPTRGETALELIGRLPSDELAAVLREYGEERYAARISRAIKEAAHTGALETTLDLAASVEAAIPAPARRRQRIHPATRTFQALRIAVNRELDQLARFLELFPDLLAPGGRCAIISFHSLEDRMVKRRFRDLAWSSSLPPDLARQAGERVAPICTVLTKRPVTAGDDEIARNPRARSAKLRACQKLPEPLPN